MNTAVFENATIADILNKAARVSPNENSSAFNHAPGLYIHVMADGTIVVRSTDTELFYTQWTSCVEKTDGEWEWHISARIAKWIDALPNGSGKLVTFTEEDGILKLKHGRSLNKIHLIRGFNFPQWDAFDQDNTYVIEDFAEKLEKIQWAAALAGDDANPTLSGVYLDGEKMVTANRNRSAVIPFDFPPAKHRAMTIPFKILAPLVKRSVEMKVCIMKQGLGIEPDDYSQVIVTAFADNPAERMTKLPGPDDFDHHIEFNTEQFSELLKRMITSVDGADIPLIKLLILNGNIMLTMSGKKDEIVQEVLEVPNYANHDYAAMVSFNPDDLLRSISNTPSHSAKFWYNKDAGRINLISSGEYRAWLAQRIDINA